MDIQDTFVQRVKNADTTVSVLSSESDNSNLHIVTGNQALAIRAKYRLRILSLAWKRYGLSGTIFSVLRELIEKNKAVHGESVLKKWVKTGGKNYFYLYAPGYPSVAADRMLVHEMERVDNPSLDQTGLRFAFFAITKKCPMRCEHCFEWDNINQKEVLDYSSLRTIVVKLIEAGISQVHISGGEPMLRVKEIEKLAQEFSDRIEFWVLTSGYNCSKENIQKLKSAGVTGLVVSLDHYDQEAHDHFRGYKGAYSHALTAIANGRLLEMPVAISVCVTKQFCTVEHLQRYADLAKSLDVSFLQLLEPKAVGHYSNKDVLLNSEQLSILESFYKKYSMEDKYPDHPILVYHGYYQRRVGCFTAANRALYVDTNGDAMSCPFCHCSSGNLLRQDMKDIISAMRMKGCSTFGSSRV